MAEVAVKAVSSATIGKQVFSEIWGGGGGLGGSIFNAVIASSKIDELKGLTSGYVNYLSGLGYTYRDLAKANKLGEVYTDILKVIDTNERFSLDAWKAGLGMGIGGSLAGAIEKYVGSSRLVSATKSLMIEEGVVPWLQRYFKREYTPNLPDTLTAFKMCMEGLISRSEFNTYASLEGWGSEWYDKLYSLLDREPDEYLAFQMYKRGIIAEAEMKKYFSIRGYDTALHTKLYLGLHRIPSFREITALSDFVELPDLWVREKLRANGYQETDIPYMAVAISKRPNREEVRSVVGRYLWEYQIGRITKEALTAGLKALGLLATELSLNLTWAELRYQDQLLDLKEDIIEEKVNQGVITTQEDIVTALTGIGYLEEYANLLAELWYYKYLYVPP